MRRAPRSASIPIAAAITLLAVASSCAGAPAPTSRAPPVPRGEALYLERCGQCHDLVPAGAYTGAQWQSVLSRMQPYAGLKDDEVDAIAEWIQRAE